jgi:hypothetical protein
MNIFQNKRFMVGALYLIDIQKAVFGKYRLTSCFIFIPVPPAQDELRNSVRPEPIKRSG